MFLRKLDRAITKSRPSRAIPNRVRDSGRPFDWLWKMDYPLQRVKAIDDSNKKTPFTSNSNIAKHIFHFRRIDWIFWRSYFIGWRSNCDTKFRCRRPFIILEGNALLDSVHSVTISSGFKTFSFCDAGCQGNASLDNWAERLRKKLSSAYS